MATPGRARNMLATVIGYVIVAIVLWYVFRFILGTLFWIVRTFMIVIVLAALIWLYFKLKSPKERDADE